MTQSARFVLSIIIKSSKVLYSRLPLILNHFKPALSAKDLSSDICREDFIFGQKLVVMRDNFKMTLKIYHPVYCRRWMLFLFCSSNRFKRKRSNRFQKCLNLKYPDMTFSFETQAKIKRSL